MTRCLSLRLSEARKGADVFSWLRGFLNIGGKRLWQTNRESNLSNLSRQLALVPNLLLLRGAHTGSLQYFSPASGESMNVSLSFTPNPIQAVTFPLSGINLS